MKVFAPAAAFSSIPQNIGRGWGKETPAFPSTLFTGAA